MPACLTHNQASCRMNVSTKQIEEVNSGTTARWEYENKLSEATCLRFYGR